MSFAGTPISASTTPGPNPRGKLLGKNGPKVLRQSQQQHLDRRGDCFAHQLLKEQHSYHYDHCLERTY